MGTFTELIFGAKLKKEIPKGVVEVLEFATGKIDNIQEELIDELFSYEGHNSNWINYLFGRCSFYFGARIPTIIFEKDIDGQYVLSTRSNIKNYNKEIESFLCWIKPYIAQGSGAKWMYAIVIREDEFEPKIYYLDEMD